MLNWAKVVDAINSTDNAVSNAPAPKAASSENWLGVNLNLNPNHEPSGSHCEERSNLLQGNAMVQKIATLTLAMTQFCSC